MVPCPQGPYVMSPMVTAGMTGWSECTRQVLFFQQNNSLMRTIFLYIVFDFFLSLQLFVIFVHILHLQPLRGTPAVYLPIHGQVYYH